VLEEENAVLAHLLRGLEGGCVLVSAMLIGCWLVEEQSTSRAEEKAIAKAMDASFRLGQIVACSKILIRNQCMYIMQ
jgi:hypothetical protein